MGRPSARTWGDQLNGCYSGNCATQVNNMLAAVKQAMQGQQPQVTPQEAASIAKEMSMIERGM